MDWSSLIDLELSDGKVCVYFEGYDIGQGGSDVEYIGTYKSREMLVKQLEDKPFFSLEIHN